MESKGTFFNSKLIVLSYNDLFFFLAFLGESQATYKTLRKETTMTNIVKRIAKNTKTDFAKSYQIVNSKATNPKFRT